MIEVTCESVRIHKEQAYILMTLRERGGDRFLAIRIGDFEAKEIAIILQNVSTSVPLVYDFAVTLIQKLGGVPSHVSISELRGDRFSASLSIIVGEASIEVAARPSDVVNVAIRTKIPIFVNEDLLMVPSSS